MDEREAQKQSQEIAEWIQIRKEKGDGFMRGTTVGADLAPYRNTVIIDVGCGPRPFVEHFPARLGVMFDCCMGGYRKENLLQEETLDKELRWATRTISDTEFEVKRAEDRLKKRQKEIDKHQQAIKVNRDATIKAQEEQLDADEKHEELTETLAKTTSERETADATLAQRRKEIAQLLIAKGADVNAEDKSGVTPLHSAKSKEVAELLVAKGADIKAKNEAIKLDTVNSSATRVSNLAVAST